MNDKISCLDHGYVRLVDTLGSDLSVANAARASYMKESLELSEADERLIGFLARNHHESPFRHAFLSFEVYAPLMVCRQWWRYVVGSDHTMDSWNEASRRYITIEPEFYIPAADTWRSKPANLKQGSAEPIDDIDGKLLTFAMEQTVEDGMARYNFALEKGVAPEIARGFLPAYFMYTCWRWSASLQSVTHFLVQRLKDDAQKEIQLYAKAVLELVRPYFPTSIRVIVGEDV